MPDFNDFTVLITLVGFLFVIGACCGMILQQIWCDTEEEKAGLAAWASILALLLLLALPITMNELSKEPTVDDTTQQE